MDAFEKRPIPMTDFSITPTLRPKIENFVNKLGVVHQEQVFRYFRSCNADTILWCLRSLVRSPAILFDPEKMIYMSRAYKMRREKIQFGITEAAWFLANLGDEEVRHFDIDTYPFALLIITEDNQVYCLSYARYDEVRQMNYLCQSTRMIRTIDKENGDDFVEYILILESEESADLLKSNKITFDFLAYYNENHSVNYIEL